MRGSSNLDRPSNVEIGVEYQINLVVVCFFKIHFGATSRSSFSDLITKIAEQLILHFNPAKHKKVNKHFKI